MDIITCCCSYAPRGHGVLTSESAKLTETEVTICVVLGVRIPTGKESEEVAIHPLPGYFWETLVSLELTLPGCRRYTHRVTWSEMGLNRNQFGTLFS